MCPGPGVALPGGKDTRRHRPLAVPLTTHIIGRRARAESAALISIPRPAAGAGLIRYYPAEVGASARQVHSSRPRPVSLASMLCGVPSEVSSTDA